VARRPRLQPRERSLDAIGAWLGEARALAAEFSGDDRPATRIRTFSEAAPDDLRTAHGLLGLIDDLGVVVHGPRGCAAAPREVSRLVATTDLDQRDTVLGSGEALADTIRRLDSTASPAAIVVLGSPVVAINSDEIRATVAAIAEEIGKPVVWARTEGFRSRIAATGADAAAEALLGLANSDEAPPRDDAVLNLLAPWRSREVDRLAEAIEALGLTINLLPADARVADISRATRAAASLVLDPDLLGPLASALESRFGVARIDAHPPVGAAATAQTLRKIATKFGRTPPTASEPALAEHTSVDAALDGKRIAVVLPPAFGFAAAGLLDELGAEIVALSTPHLDRSHAAALASFAARRPAAQTHVGDAQGFELVNLLRRIKPDILLGSAEAAATALRLGIPSAVIAPERLIGAQAAAALAGAARDALAGAAFARRAARIGRERYTPGWLRRSPDWHIKLEVK
jgi:nitrogenase molybdenum-cofactor synthesis protein NifE